MADDRDILAVKGLEANTSDRFRWLTLQMADRLQMNADYLAAVMAFETGGTFDPAIRNPDSRAVGLIQFTKLRAKLAGTTRDALARMSAVQQLEYVERALAPLKGRPQTLADHYATVFAPAHVGKPDSLGMYFADAETQEGRNAYEWNKGLDANGDGVITKGEAAGPVASIVAAANQRPRLPVTEPKGSPNGLPSVSNNGALFTGALLAVAGILGIRRWKANSRY